MFEGISPAVVTPFTAADATAVDHDALARNVAKLLADGCDAIVVNGTMGEATSLNHSERSAVIATAVAAASGRPVIAGISSTDWSASSRLAADAEAAGANGLMCLPPVAYEATDAEVNHHYQQILECTSLPVIVYNNPAASKIDMSVERIVELAQHPQVVAVKEASMDVRRVAHLRNATSDDFTVLIGADDWALEGYAAGATGWISGTANVAPTACKQLEKLTMSGSLKEARNLYSRLLPLARLDVTPLLVQYYKFAMDQVGFTGGPVRPPLSALNETQRKTVLCALQCLDQ